MNTLPLVVVDYICGFLPPKINALVTFRIFDDHVGVNSNSESTEYLEKGHAYLKLKRTTVCLNDINEFLVTFILFTKHPKACSKSFKEFYVTVEPDFLYKAIIYCFKINSIEKLERFLRFIRLTDVSQTLFVCVVRYYATNYNTGIPTDAITHFLNCIPQDHYERRLRRLQSIHDVVLMHGVKKISHKTMTNLLKNQIPGYNEEWGTTDMKIICQRSAMYGICMELQSFKFLAIQTQLDFDFRLILLCVKTQVKLINANVENSFNNESFLPIDWTRLTVEIKNAAKSMSFS